MESHEKNSRSRLFVAVEINDECRAEVSRCIEGLKGAGADVGWVRPENLHITLKFLGSTGMQFETILSALQPIAQRKFEMTLEGLGAFPNLNGPKVIFADVTEGREGLKTLASLLEKALAPLGFAEEGREFHPHLTIGRVRSPKNLKKLNEKMVGRERQMFGKISVVRFCLVKSELGANGPVYTNVGEIQLI